MTETIQPSHQAIIQALSFPGDTLPGDALRNAIKHYDDIKPALHASLKLSINEIKNIKESAEEGYKLKFYAMYLAAETRDTDAFPLIRDYFSTQGEQAWDCLGNISTRDMGRILASVCNGDACALKSFAELDGMDSFARISCLDAMGILMCQNDFPRNTLVEWFRAWLRGDMLNQQEYGYLANICILLVLKELKEDLLAALKAGHLDAEAITLEDIEDELPHAEISDFTRRLFAPVHDVVNLIAECSMRSYLTVLFTMFERDDFDTLMPFFQQNRETKAAGKFIPEFLHGFMFGIVITPALILPSEWYPILFDDGMPEFQSEKEDEAAQQGLLIFYNRLNNDRLDGFIQSPFNAANSVDKELTPMAREWCRGFARAIALRPQYWLTQEDPHSISVFTESITTIMVLSDQHKADDLLIMSGRKVIPVEQEKLLIGSLENLSFAINTLINHAFDSGAEYHPTAMHKPVRSTKVRRNEPCPCGSGKKFKKCCSAAGRSVH